MSWMIPHFDRSPVHQARLHLHVRDIRVMIKAMPALDKMSLTELEELAAKLRHTIARNPEHSRMSRLNWRTCSSGSQFARTGIVASLSPSFVVSNSRYRTDYWRSQRIFKLHRYLATLPNVIH